MEKKNVDILIVLINIAYSTLVLRARKNQTKFNVLCDIILFEVKIEKK